MQISASSSSSLSGLSHLKAKEAAQAAAAPVTPAAQAPADTFTTAASAPSDNSAAIYKKPIPTPEPVSRADQSAEKVPDPVLTAEPAAEEAATKQAETPAPPSFGVSEFQEFLQQFGKSSGDQDFNAKMDLNGDGRVDGSDLSVVLANFRRS